MILGGRRHWPSTAGLVSEALPTTTELCEPFEDGCPGRSLIRKSRTEVFEALLLRQATTLVVQNHGPEVFSLEFHSEQESRCDFMTLDCCSSAYIADKDFKISLNTINRL